MLSEDHTQYAADWILNDEDYRQFPYDDANGKPILDWDTEGFPTVGIGFNLASTGFSLPECLLILRHRIGKLDALLAKTHSWYSEIDGVRSSVLVNMAYNLGDHGLEGFHEMLSFLAVHDYLNASKALMQSKAAIDDHYRYERLSEALLTGKYPSFIQLKEQKQ